MILQILKNLKLSIEAHASRTGPFLKQLASPEIDGKQHSFLTVEPYGHITLNLNGGKNN